LAKRFGIVAPQGRDRLSVKFRLMAIRLFLLLGNQTARLSIF
jgi:hypothetical protein